MVRGFSKWRKNQIEQSETFQYVEGLSYNHKLSYMQKLARANNQRLRRLENAGIRSEAYKRAVYDNKSRTRFYTGSKYASEKELENAIIRGLSFKEAEGSTVRGYKAGWKRRIDTVRENRPQLESISDKDLIRLFESGYAGISIWNSEDFIDAVAEHVEDGWEVDDLIEALNDLDAAGDLEFQKFMEL